MSQHIRSATRVEAVGNKPKLIDEFIGRVNTGHLGVSVARMQSPEGWVEPGQTPEFDEVTLVLSGVVHVETRQGSYSVRAGEAFWADAGEWVQYSTPEPGGATYVAVCVPAFSPSSVHRDSDSSS